MVVTTVGTGLEGLQQAFATLGGALGMPSKENRREEEVQNLLLQNPALIGELAKMTRAAMRTGIDKANEVTSDQGPPQFIAAAQAANKVAPINNLANAIGIDPKILLDLEKASPASMEELTNQELMDWQGPEGETFPQLMAKVGFNQAYAQVAASRATVAESDFKTDLFEQRTKDGIAELTVNTEKLAAQAGIRDMEFAEKIFGDFTNWYNSLPNGQTKTIIMSMLRNRDVGNALLTMRGQDLQAQLASARAGQQDFEGAVRLWFTANERLNELIGKAKEAKGTELTILTNQINDVSRFIEGMTDLGLPRSSLVTAVPDFFLKDEPILTPHAPETRSEAYIRNAVNKINSGEATMDDVVNSHRFQNWLTPAEQGLLMSTGSQIANKRRNLIIGMETGQVPVQEPGFGLNKYTTDRIGEGIGIMLRDFGESLDRAFANQSNTPVTQGRAR